MPGEFIARNGMISRGNVVVTGSLTTSGSLTTTGTITATTLVVQTITSSISSITGSTNFGSLLANTHTFTGSMNLTGSLTVNTTGTELQVNANGVNLGNALTDSHIISGSVRINPSTLVVSSSGNIGIGTINPTRPLQVSRTTGQSVVGIIAATNDSADIFFGDTDNEAEAVVRFINGTNTFNILNGGSTRVTVTASGSVGIGTTSPTSLLEVQANQNTQTGIRVRNSTSGTSAGVEFGAYTNSGNGGFGKYSTGNTPYKNIAAASTYVYNGSSGDIALLNDVAAGNISFAAGGASSAQLFVSAGGNVGIGTTSPSNLLHVSGTPASSGILARFQSTATSGSISISHSGNGGSLGYASLGAGTQSNVFYVTTGAGTIGSGILVDNGGALYINSTSNQLSNATPQLGILAGAGTDAINIKHTQNGNNTVNIWQTGTATFSAIAFYKGDSQILVGSISVATSGTTYNTTSDYRLKENVVPLENGLDRLMQLKPSKFNWTTTGEETEGFIAHEVQEVFPYAVTGEKDAVYTSTGNIKPQSVDYGRITPLLVKAIQELKAENDSLKLRIEALENK